MLLDHCLCKLGTREKNVKYLDSLSDTCMRIEEFYRLWTLKESFVKAIGAGLAINLGSFNIISGYKTSVCCLKDDFATKPVEILEKNKLGSVK